MSAILKFELKKENNYVFWGKLPKLHKKDPILHVATIFSLKQGESRTSHGPIPHPLNSCLSSLHLTACLRWFQTRQENLQTYDKKTYKRISNDYSAALFTPKDRGIRPNALYEG